MKENDIAKSMWIYCKTSKQKQSSEITDSQKLDEEGQLMVDWTWS